MSRELKLLGFFGCLYLLEKALHEIGENVVTGVVAPFKLHRAIFGVFWDVVLMWH